MKEYPHTPRTMWPWKILKIIGFKNLMLFFNQKLQHMGLVPVKFDIGGVNVERGKKFVLVEEREKNFLRKCTLLLSRRYFIFVNNGIITIRIIQQNRFQESEGSLQQQIF